MKKNIFRSVCCTLLCILLLQSTLLASTILSPSEIHDLNSYVANLTLSQKKIYTLAQDILFTERNDNTSAQITLSILEGYLDEIEKDMDSSLSNTSSGSTYYRDLLLLANTLNYIRNSLWELTTLLEQNSPSEKLSTLERFFNFRIYANNTLRFFDTLQSTK